MDENLKKHLEFLEYYQEYILKKNNPIIKRASISNDEFVFSLAKDKKYWICKKELTEDFPELRDKKTDYVIINNKHNGTDMEKFTLMNAHIFSFERSNKKIYLTSNTEKKFEFFKHWYIVKLSLYFQMRTLDRIATRIKTNKFSTLDKHLLGIELIHPEENVFDPKDSKHIPAHFNDSQKEALKQMISSKKICIVKGPPGTGKTLVIEKYMEYSLTSDPERRILFMTNLHSSIDGLVRKMNLNNFFDQFDILRLTKKAHSRTTKDHKKLTKTKRANVYLSTTASQRMNQVYSENKEMFHKKPTLIIDEASTTTLLNILSHTEEIGKVIIVGDERQLRPIFDSRDFETIKPAHRNSFDLFIKDSLFEHLYKLNKQKINMLNVNYRSTKQVVDTFNGFYKNELQIGNKSIEGEVRSYEFDDDIRLFAELQRQINDRKLTIKNTIFITGYKSTVLAINDYLGKKIFRTSSSVQGDEADNVVFVLNKSANGDSRFQLDYRTINVVLSRSKKNIYIFSTRPIVNDRLIDIHNGWKEVGIDGKFLSVSTLIKPKK